MNNDRWYSPFNNTLWSITETDWKERDWRVVGSNPFKMRILDQIERKNRNNMPEVFPEVKYNSLIELIESISDRVYIIEFKSGRLDIGYSTTTIPLYKYVIIEADRGVDCGKVIGFTDKYEYLELINKIDKSYKNKEIHPKKIYRRAAIEDLSVLKSKSILEEKALKRCVEKAKCTNLHMEVVNCEYQWDMNKLIFYFKSDEKIDFRELVKSLYKDYKVRIWMCAIDKSKNNHFRTLL